MTRRTRKLATAATAAALLALAGGAGSATAADVGDVFFYSGTGQSGSRTPASLDDPGTCHNLAEPALSGLDYAVDYVNVYFNSDCRTGAPGTSSDLYYVLGSLHADDFPYPAVSYRVRPAS
ncbi:hypothetical protein GCM10018793_46540 [Streptomyces sulfonofaciens]|uniref:Uncharacterized protein n=1 Tax=Streptomyces sulfonofaciens TaxID=68272 RepID=A0A919GGW9_9ACTN|nr:hypothetical protein [Streptomyces sulfonofaciens]GHH83730.1 hypothetical protein GCM10018793_46540 [Streptomyces sulfonofaciens]